ncbi:right-handed parallel beta-helix repeat-containing protein [Spirosoma gilvum]
MRLIIYILLICTAQIANAQRTFYVSNAGSDSNNGLSQSTPFQTINKVNTLILQAGDNVLFRRGDIFRGTLNIVNSGGAGNPIRIDAYGAGGNKPVISGSTLVNGWTSIGGNKWQATCPSCGTSVTGLYQNNSTLPLGRYPNLDASNKGYQTVQSHIGKTQLVSQQPLTTNWVGGEVVYRPNLWIINRAPITQQNGNALTLNNTNAGYDLTDGWGYFIQNHPATLDQSGEWYYNSSTKTFQLFSLQDPNNQQITATVANIGVYLGNVTNVSIQNLKVTETFEIGVSAFNISNCTIANLDIINSGQNGLVIHGGGNTVMVENNLIDQSNNNGVEIKTLTNLTFRKNKVKRAGIIPGRGNSGDSQYLGVATFVTTNLIFQDNIIDSVGFHGISFSAQTTGLTISKNVISNFLLTKTEGGGVYTFNGSQLSMSNNKIISNIIYNGIGSLEGAVPGPTYSGVNGVYLDGCTQNVEVGNNTVFNCRGIGIFMIAVSNNNVYNNTFFNNNESQLVLAAGNACPPRNNTLTGNIMVSKTPTQPVARYESAGTDLGQYGNIDNNYYARPFDDAIKINAAFLDVNTNSSNAYGLKDWQRLYSKDLNSKESPINYKGFKINSITGANRIGNGSFNNDISEWYSQSYYNNGKLEWNNGGQLDGGSMRIYFQPTSGFKASYIFVYHDLGVITSGTSYVLRFDALSSINGKTLHAYLRTRNGAQELATRVGSLLGTTRKYYEVAFTATVNDSDAVLVLQALEDGESMWLDNISFQEATITKDNPDDFIKLYYNPHSTDTTISLNGNYRDVKNQFYNHQITLSSFSSVVLLRDLSPDLTPTVYLPQGNFATAPDNVRSFSVNLFESNSIQTPSGSVNITVSVPVGYSISFNNTITSINVSGGSSNPVSVDNTKWTVTNNVSNQQLTLKINAGQTIPANSNSVLGFTLTRTSANSGSVSNITVNITDDPTRGYDGNSLNNIYSRVIISI